MSSLLQARETARFKKEILQVVMFFFCFCCCGHLRRYGIFLASGEELDLDEVGEHVDTVVGVVLLLLGVYGLAQVCVRERGRGGQQEAMGVE